jgi:tetratricopeptide (TPR) repeat protein
LADTAADVQKLKDEALEILKANAARQATAEQYATCIFKLEQAQGMLEKAGDSSSTLAQGVSSTLFWARRFSNVQVLAALDKLHGGKAPPPPPPAKKAEPAKPAGEGDAPAELPSVLVEARKAFAAAEGFAKAHSGDDYAVALAWFQMAAGHPGNDYAFKALELARQAQARFAAKAGNKASTEEVLPDTPAMKLVKDADALAQAGNFETAFPLYQASLKVQETFIGHRKLAHAYYLRAQQMKDEFLPQFEAAEEERRAAYKDAFVTVRTLRGSYRKLNPNYPPLVAAQRKEVELVKQANVAISFYDKAHDELDRKSVV